MQTDYDVVVLGAGFAGSATALLLRRWVPESRILVVEQRAEGERKVAEVGEATVEVSACFLHRVLGLYDYLANHQLPKHGLRYWFTDGPERKLEEMTEIGPMEAPRLPSFQLDRATLDEEILRRAVAAGCELARPAQCADVELGWPVSRVKIAGADGERMVSTRWVVDASGRRTFLSKRLGLFKRVEDHPTTAVWARWNGVLDLDGVDVLGVDPRQPRLKEIAASRRLATNHFCGYGWWCWVIPLAGGRTSVGIVYNKQLFELPGEGSKTERYRRFVTRHPGLRELLATAQMDDDAMSLAHLPYRSSRYMDKGWALVGDAAAFIDPYYSPGLDHASMSIYSTARLLEDELAGKLDEACLETAIAAHNAAFERSYDRWIESLYIDKYELLGDAELTACAFLVDTASYYLGVVAPAYRDLDELRFPVFGRPVPQTRIAASIMRTFNRRMVYLARLRRRQGTYGQRNAQWRLLARPFGLRQSAVRPLVQGLRIWLRMEREAFFGRFRRPPSPEVVATPASVPST